MQAGFIRFGILTTDGAVFINGFSIVGSVPEPKLLHRLSGSTSKLERSKYGISYLTNKTCFDYLPRQVLSMGRGNS